MNRQLEAKFVLRDEAVRTATRVAREQNQVTYLARRGDSWVVMLNNFRSQPLEGEYLTARWVLPTGEVLKIS